MTRMTRMTLAMIAGAVCGLNAARAQPGEPIAQAGTQPERPKIMIHGVEYQKLATREATEKRILDQLAPTRVRWGTWRILTSFEFPNFGHLKDTLPPEAELAKMAPGGAGPDFAKEYPGHKGMVAKWAPVDKKIDEPINFLDSSGKGHQENVAGYLHTTATVEKAMTLDVTMGSDDGMRFWLNGRLLADVDEPRSMDPGSNRLRLDLRPGVNHIFVKVSQSGYGWEYQMVTAGVLDPTTKQLLDYHLDVDFPPTPEAEYYRSFPILLPEDVVMEVGGLATLPDGRPIVSTRRGDVYIVDGAYAEPPTECAFTLFASGLHEPLGLAVRQEEESGRKVSAVYCVQRGEMTRMVDVDGDGRADLYQTFSDGWGVSGNYHEFAFGPKFDREGNAWMSLNVGFCDALGKSMVPWRGWALKVDPKGTLTPVSGGVRSPNGIGFWLDGQAFYMDNQGDYVGTNRLAPLYQDGWNGHPSGLRWRKDYTKAMDEPKNYPPLTPAAVWFPYKKMGQSVADFVTATAFDGAKAGAFGPFDNQGFAGDQTLCNVMRVTLEKVDGVYQGACYPFRQGLQCGVNRIAWGKDGSMFVGQTDRGWGSIGRARYGLERIKWTGKTPFEMKEIRIAPGGFDIEFTEDLDAKSAGDLASYSCESYTYEYHAKYGSDEMETRKPKVTRATVTGPRTVRIELDEVRAGGMGYVHEIFAAGVRAGSGAALLHPMAYYTVQRKPGA